jgi:hypothetical protein
VVAEWTAGAAPTACKTRRMEWLVIFLIAGLAYLAFAGMRQQKRALEAKQQKHAAELAVVRGAVEEDVVAFGEDLSRLGNELPSGMLDEGGRADYRRALDSYEAAKQATDALQNADETRHVATIIDDGRYAIACVRARVEGQPLPQRRPACFFDPRHGQSVTDVLWTPPGGVTRDVPACALDAERVHAGAEPATRQVLVGSQRVPYWQAGGAFAPMALGYFGAFGIAQSLFLGTAMGTMLGGGFDGLDVGGDGGDAGSDAGSDAGGDFGGGDFGGGDFGGGFDF